MCQMTIEDYAHGEFVLDEKSGGDMGEFDVATYDASDWPEELCGADAVSNALKWSERRMRLTVVFLSGRQDGF